jgi:hypothetical protein
VKFILDSAGNRGVWAGTLVTDADVQDHFDRANEILAGVHSEFEVELVEIEEVSGAMQHFATKVADVIGDLRGDARDNRTQYGWSEDAINLYITGGSGSGVAFLPGILGRNDIIVMGQGPNATTLTHEIGHIVDLEHTFDNDHCSDTLVDRNPREETGGWDKDDIANENYGMSYSSLSGSQLALVDQTFGDVMSYHDGNNRFFFSHCQMNRSSDQAFSDRSWMLARLPLYVHPQITFPGGDGSWSLPYGSIDWLLEDRLETYREFPGIDGRTIVLLEGAEHSLSRPLTGQDVEVISRRSPATVHEDVSIWNEPPSPELPEDPQVAAAMRDLQAADRAGDAAAAIEALRVGETHATGRELGFIRYKLAQRLRHAGRLVESFERYEQVASEAGDPGLRDAARHWAGRVEKDSKRAERSIAGREAGGARPHPLDARPRPPGSNEGPPLAAELSHRRRASVSSVEEASLRPSSIAGVPTPAEPAPLAAATVPEPSLAGPSPLRWGALAGLAVLVVIGLGLGVGRARNRPSQK